MNKEADRTLSHVCFKLCSYYFVCLNHWQILDVQFITVVMRIGMKPLYQSATDKGMIWQHFPSLDLNIYCLIIKTTKKIQMLDERFKVQYCLQIQQPSNWTKFLILHGHIVISFIIIIESRISGKLFCKTRTTKRLIWQYMVKLVGLI